jgi:GntR family transcriptional regulator
MTTRQLPQVPATGGHPALHAYRILLDAVRAGVFPVDTQLPGERALAGQLGVSRATVRQVLIALADTGMVYPSANRGWFVAGRKLSEGPNLLRSFSDQARDRGLTPTAQVLRQEVRSATLDEAERLAMAPAAPMLEIERLRGMDGVAVCVQTTCLPLARVPGLHEADLTDQSLFRLLAERYDLVVARCDYEVQAEAAPERIARLLGVAVGSPLLAGYETTFDQDEQPLGSGRSMFRGDAYRFKASLFQADR